MIICDLCGDPKDCLQKEIEGKEYDICSECWSPFAQKLKGKGRKKHETVFLPPPRVNEREDEEPKPLPGEPPKIFGALERHINPNIHSLIELTRVAVEFTRPAPNFWRIAYPPTDWTAHT